MRKWINTILVMMSLVMIIPIEYYCMLSVPFADDFGAARSSVEYYNKYGSYLLAALIRTKEYWFGFQGSYTGLFLMIFLNPYARWDLPGLRIVNALCVLLLLVSLFVCVAVLFKNSRNRWTVTLAGYSIVLYWITNNYMNSEMYTWNNVIYIYTVPLMFCFFGVGAYIEYLRNRQYEWIIALLCGIIAGGGTINIAIFTCSLYMIVFLFGIFQGQIRKSVRFATPFAITVLCSLFNTFAPGNFVRLGDSPNIWKVLLSSFLNVLKRMGYFSVKTPFIALIIVFFIILYTTLDVSFEGVVKYEHPLLVGLMYILICTAVNLPYCYGAHNESIRNILEDRTYYVQDIAIYSFTVLWLLYLVGYIRKKNVVMEFKNYHISMIAAFLIAAFLLAFGSNGYDNITTSRMIKSILDGSAVRYAGYQEEILNQVRDGNNIEIIYYDCNKCPRRDPLIKGLRLADDPDRWDMWYNRSMAKYFGKTVAPIVVYDD